MATGRLEDDWEERRDYRPVLVESFFSDVFPDALQGLDF